MRGESLGCVNLLRLICRYLGFPTTRQLSHSRFAMHRLMLTAPILDDRKTVTGGYNASFSTFMFCLGSGSFSEHAYTPWNYDADSGYII